MSNYLLIVMVICSCSSILSQLISAPILLGLGAIPVVASHLSIVLAGAVQPDPLPGDLVVAAAGVEAAASAPGVAVADVAAGVVVLVSLDHSLSWELRKFYFSDVIEPLSTAGRLSSASPPP